MPLQPERDDVLATEPCPFTGEVKQAYELFLREIDSEGWEGELKRHDTVGEYKLSAGCADVQMEVRKTMSSSIQSPYLESGTQRFPS